MCRPTATGSYDPLSSQLGAIATTTTGLTSLNSGGDLWTSVTACRLIAINRVEGNLLFEQALISDSRWPLLNRSRDKSLKALEYDALYRWIFPYTRQ